MNKTAVIAAALVALAAPALASAHQTATYKIGDAYYKLTIGSMNEPIVVDDKTGLELSVERCSNSSCSAPAGHDGHHASVGSAVEGLETTLKVELAAGEARKVLSISPAYGEPGSYSAPFYITRATTFSYRLFGEVGETPVDLTFTCTPPGATRAADQTAPVQLSEGVTQLTLKGGFGCALEKEPMGFPDEAASSVEVAKDIRDAHSSVGTVLAVIALVFSAAALSKVKKGEKNS